jgi:hypothetical protein
MQKWEQHFEDWNRLLKTANAEDLLQDPKAVWDEAWRHVAMVAIGIVESKQPYGNLAEAAIALKKELL